MKEDSEKVGLKLNIQKTKIMTSGPITSWQINNGYNGNSKKLYFVGFQNHCRWELQPWNSKMLATQKKSYDKPRQHIKKQRHYFANKGLSSQRYSFSSGHVWMWELDHKESWVLKNWYFWTVVLEMTLESPLDCKEVQPVNPKGNQSWIFTEGLMLKLKLQYVGQLMQRTDSAEKTLILGKIEGRRKRGRNGWMAPLTWWTWVWASSGSWW